MPLPAARYARPPMSPQRGMTIADLIMRRGDIAARGAERSGAIWGNAVANLGNIAAGAIQQHGQQKEAEQRQVAFDEALQSWDPADPNQSFMRLARVAGPEPAMQITRGLMAITESQQRQAQGEAPDIKLFAAKIGGLRALRESMGPEYVQQHWAEIQPALAPDVKALLGVDLGPEWTPEYDQALDALAEQLGPEEAPKGFTLSPGQTRFGPEGERIAAVAPKPEKSLEDQAREQFALAKARAKGAAAGKPPEEEMAGLDWSKTGEDFLATLPAELQATVQQLGEYRRRPSASLYRSEAGRRLLAMVSQYNPEYDEKLYGEGQKAIGEFTSGATHRNIIAINTLSHHLVPFAEAASALDNNDTQALNKLKNYFSRELGSEVPTNFEALRHLVSDEIANTFKTTGATDSTIKNAADTVYAAQSPAQLLGALKRLARLAEGRIRAIGNKYDVTFGQGAFDKKGYISDEARHAYEMIGGAAGLGDIGEGETAAGLEAIADALAGLGLSQEDLAAALEEP